MTQQKALEVLKSGKNVFLTGEPGSGKTHTINQFVEWAKLNGGNVAVTASTGIAATHIDGQTIHSWSGIGIKSNISRLEATYILQKPWVREKMSQTNILIIDEVSMLDAQVVEDVNTMLVTAHASSFGEDYKPFGGIQIVFVGDFFQLPPVAKKGAQPRFAFESTAWKDADLTVCYLTEQHRQSDQQFLDILSSMRNGAVKKKHKDVLAKRTFNHQFMDMSIMTKLFTHNVEVDNINQRELAKIDGEERTFVMESYGIPFLIEVLKKSCLSPAKLTLKIGARVMFTRNNFEEGYVNGSIGIVTRYSSSGMPYVHLKDGREILTKYYNWSIEDDKAMVSQVPLRLAWAITVHKSQGMSLDEAEIDLSKCFEFGQGYVALSRVRSLDGLYLKGINDKAFLMHPKVIEEDKLFRESSEKI